MDWVVQCAPWLIWMCNVTHLDVQRDSFMCVTEANATRHIYVFETWLIQMCDMTHSDVQHDSCMCVTASKHHTSYLRVWHDSFTRVTWLVLTRDMTHWVMRHDSFQCATRLIPMCDMTHSCVRQQAAATRHICVWDMTHSYTWHDLSTPLSHTHTHTHTHTYTHTHTHTL